MVYNWITSTNMSVTFTNCTKEQAIEALWAMGGAVGLGALHSHNAPSEGDIAQVVQDEYADYLNGKPMKISLKYWPNVSSGGYDRDNGRMAMQSVADALAAGAALRGGETKKLDDEERDEVVALANSRVTVVGNRAARVAVAGVE